jgi:hypothetical protein
MNVDGGRNASSRQAAGALAAIGQVSVRAGAFALPHGAGVVRLSSLAIWSVVSSTMSAAWPALMMPYTPSTGAAITVTVPPRSNPVPRPVPATLGNSGRASSSASARSARSPGKSSASSGLGSAGRPGSLQLSRRPSRRNPRHSWPLLGRGVVETASAR